jgi:hypothetical protein
VSSSKIHLKGSLEKIEIKEKITPFSHQNGIECLVPLSDWVVQVFPALIKVHNFEFPIKITGPVKEFTVQMDLERECLWIWGIANEGHYRLKIFADDLGLSLYVDRAPKSGIQIGGHQLERKGKLGLAKGGQFSHSPEIERLSLGNWKAQDWDLVRRRGDFKEIAPLLFMLGQKLPFVETLPLIHQEHFFLAALSGLCAPKPQDAINQGLPPFDVEPIALIQSAYRTIRQFLIQGDYILPRLPSDWTAGKVVGLQTESGTLDIEWTKGHMRRMIFSATETSEVKFLFTKEISSCRCNGAVLENGTLFAVEGNKKYLFDHFQK